MGKRVIKDDHARPKSKSRAARYHDPNLSFGRKSQLRRASLEASKQYSDGGSSPDASTERKSTMTWGLLAIVESSHPWDLKGNSHLGRLGKIRNLRSKATDMIETQIKRIEEDQCYPAQGSGLLILMEQPYSKIRKEWRSAAVDVHILKEVLPVQDQDMISQHHTIANLTGRMGIKIRSLPPEKDTVHLNWTTPLLQESIGSMMVQLVEERLHRRSITEFPSQSPTQPPHLNFSMVPL